MSLARVTTFAFQGIEAVLGALDRARPEETSPSVLRTLRRQHADRRTHLAATADEGTPDDPVAEAGALELHLVDVERAALSRAYEEGRLTDEARRRTERELDLEDARIRHALASAGAGGDGSDE